MQYIAKYNRKIATLEEFNMRMNNFIAIDALINEWNADASKTSSVGHNFLSDWTDSEKAKLTTLGKGKTKRNTNLDVPKHYASAN